MARIQNNELKSLLNKLKEQSDLAQLAKDSTKLIDELQEAITIIKVTRQKTLKSLSKTGLTYDDIGKLIGITKGRVYQILNGQSGTTKKYY